MPKTPESPSSFMKLEKGENTFRILDNPINGLSYWQDLPDGKRAPIRKKLDEQIDYSEQGTDDIKYFVAFPIWNEKIHSVQVLEITQKTVSRAIEEIIANPKWGDPREYDISIQKSGEGKETKYSVVPNPKEELSEDASKKYAEALENGFDLNKMYKGENPFGKPGMKSDEDKNPDVEVEAEEEEVNVEDIPF